MTQKICSSVAKIPSLLIHYWLPVWCHVRSKMLSFYFINILHDPLLKLVYTTSDYPSGLPTLQSSCFLPKINARNIQEAPSATLSFAGPQSNTGSFPFPLSKISFLCRITFSPKDWVHITQLQDSTAKIILLKYCLNILSWAFDCF